MRRFVSVCASKSLSSLGKSCRAFTLSAENKNATECRSRPFCVTGIYSWHIGILDLALRIVSLDPKMQSFISFTFVTSFVMSNKFLIASKSLRGE